MLTSATLAVEGAFDYAKSRLGLESAATLQLPSEFDFRRQAVFTCRRRCPTRGRRISIAPPRGSSAKSSIGPKAVRSSCSRRTPRCGRSTNDWRRGRHGRYSFREVHRGRRFCAIFERRQMPYLLATANFWQGVDVAGEALVCVIVDRLPFASPGDPLIAARLAAIERRGGHPFHEYQVPLATLHAAAGAGPTDPNQERSWRIGRAGPSPHQNVLRAPIPGVVPSGAADRQSGRGGAVL